ncbi:hypothetical protein BGZ76_001198 [Entomortierella beljakovae]|nr:hypothetical protein BGZ76_001198 [Entomortierella beljakovae]
MTMVFVQPDPFSSPIEDVLDSTYGFSLSRSNSSLGQVGSTSSTPSLDDSSDLNESEARPVLVRLLAHRDTFHMILGYLDTRSLLSLSTINLKFHREILTPIIPALSCLNTFLQTRIVVCPMAHFEGLKDFMGKYRSFKPLHLHFTYSEQSSLMSLKPDVTNPQDTTLLHTSTSPLSTSQMYGVNHSISINVSSSNSLYQYHHPLTLDQQQNTLHSQLQRQLLHTQHENDQPMSSSSLPINTSNINLMASPTQHAVMERLQVGRTGSSGSSTDSIISDNCESLNEDRGHTSIEIDSKVQVDDKSPISDLDSKIEAMTIPSNDTTNLNYNLVSQQQQQQQQQQPHSLSQQQQTQQLHQQYLRQHQPIRPGEFRMHRGAAELYLTTVLAETIPIHSNSSNPITPPPSGQAHHQGFELSYWQKFALNELFTRLLPYLKTITIGRTDKPSRLSRTRDPSTTSGELSPGVCFFLARCFNVMHDMPDTALESVIWMDVTPADVALLVTMIDLRDIMVDGRYWKRGYWTTDSPLRTRGDLGPDDSDEDDDDDDDDEENEDDWEGFYFLINQEVQEVKPVIEPQYRRKSPSPSGKLPQRKKSSVKGVTPLLSRNTTPPNSSASSSSASTSASLPRQMINTSLSAQIAGLGSIVRNGSSSLSAISPSGSPLYASFPGSALHSPTFTNSIYNSYRPGSFLRPAAWQGFGDGISGNHSPRATSPIPQEEQNHPAVSLFESYKREITDSALVARALDKGKHHVDFANSCN